MLVLLGYFLTLIMGVTLGLLGGGGSILIVPILVYLFSVSAVQATAYSLFIVGLTSAIGAIGKFRLGHVNLKISLVFALPGFLGVFFARAWLIPTLPETLFELGGVHISKDSFIMTVFAVIMILASWSMLREKKKKVAKETSTEKPLDYRLVALEGLGVGFITGFVGAGGGFLIIPALVALTGLSMNRAVGTSLVIIALKSLLGFTGDILSQPNIDWFFMFQLSGLAIVGIFLGTYLGQKIAEKKLKKAFGYFVLLMGVVILLQSLIN